MAWRRRPHALGSAAFARRDGLAPPAAAARATRARRPPDGSGGGRVSRSPTCPGWNGSRGTGVARADAGAEGAASGVEVGVGAATTGGAVGGAAGGAVAGGGEGDAGRRCASAAWTRVISFSRSSAGSRAPHEADLSSAPRAASSCPKAMHASARRKYGESRAPLVVHIG